jgi:phosphoesterase family protein
MRRLLRVAIVLLVALVASVPAGAAVAAGAAANDSPIRAQHDGLGIRPGKIKHVWLIILENKSYDATFTGLNDNTYLWRTLPSQGVLLKNYYGTGHFSFDNYISLASGQATQADTQVDCPYYDHFSGHVETSGRLRTNRNYGQMVSAQGPNAKAGANGCVYPSSVNTLFNQLHAAHVSWKGYAQDLGNSDPGGPVHDAGTRYCGAPYPKPGPTGSRAQPNPSTASATDQYLPKHFPFPWFESLLQSGQCNRAHIASLFSASDGLYHDLRRKATTPAFNWITPNMCSDGHDAVCHGNNLSGGFAGPNAPRKPVNYTGGLYAADLFLEHVIPEIERSAAYKDGGLIDVTFDEAFPPFTYTGNSFANSKLVPPDAATSIANDSAAETLFGRSVRYEPTGPNTPLAKNAHGQELYPGPGDNAFVDRPSNCVAQTVPRQPAGTCILGGGGNVPGVRTDAGASAPAGSSSISDNSIVATDAGRTVTGTGVPAGARVGQVTNTPVMAIAPNQSGGFVDTGAFTIVDAARHRLRTAGVVSGITLGPRTPSTDPLYNESDPTTGGGDTGSVLISPYIRPRTVSRRYYNHYSWLRTMEDLFGVGRVSRGLDGQGHIGYAAQLGLAPFGSDVFNSPGGRTSDHPKPALRVGRIVHASAGHPSLAIQGDTVSVASSRGQVLATAVGPVTPESHAALAATTRCTFTITFRAVVGSVPLSGAAFSILDEHQQVHQLRVTAADGGPSPPWAAPGRIVTLRMSGVLPVGQGRLLWAPDGGSPIVSWDFDLELN